MSFDYHLSPEFFDSQFRLWQQNPSRVSAQWRAFFQGFTLGGSGLAAVRSDDFGQKQAAVQSLLYRYRDLGHLLACTDPLTPCKTDHPFLTLSAFGLSEADLDREFQVTRYMKPQATLREILATMRETYCGAIGVEYMHIQNPDERQWLKDRMEPVRNSPSFAVDEKREILRTLQEATIFENFLHRKFLGQKRFSLEGAEPMIPLLDRIVKKANLSGMQDMVVGMAHRGRLNVLAHIFCKPLEQIFAEFADNLEFSFVGEGDVKYHKGFSRDVVPIGEQGIHLSLASNPSHLEAVDPVVEGKCRARQDYYGADGAAKVLPVLVHGDAAFAGQGIVAEVFNFSQLDGYFTGGTVHIVLNNQIGFTTSPAEARSSLYATDIAKMVMAPIFHVHGENPEAVAYAAELAFDYRQKFGKDIVLDVICYRRQGHNEADEPAFTQPLMYERIKERPSVSELYADQLVAEGFSRDEIEADAEEIEQRFEEAAARAVRDDRIPEKDVGYQGKWSEIQREYEHPDDLDTSVPEEKLRGYGKALCEVPEDFRVHPKIAKLFERRRGAIAEGKDIDWAIAEQLAFASLLDEGFLVRLSGQDSRRGTFNQRHAAVFDMSTGQDYVPLSQFGEKGAFSCYNSMLSEAAVLGFEYGYAIESPYGLIIWEAQFGDFVNGAQVIIDQFIVSSGTKWDRMCGLVMFLPHGYEGQGAEHSSARIERFLQLCAHENLQVCYPSTPAQFFHLLRRQLKQPFRRPLVVFTPKSLLRLPACRSRLDEMSSGRFEEVIGADLDPKKVESVLVCSGKVYYDLEERRRKEERNDVAIIRLEQLYPVHFERLEQAIVRFDGAKHIAWVQEEPRNNGAWFYIGAQLEHAIGREVHYVGRDEAAAPAVGSHRLHKEEQEALIDEAFSLNEKHK